MAGSNGRRLLVEFSKEANGVWVVYPEKVTFIIVGRIEDCMSEV